MDQKRIYLELKVDKFLFQEASFVGTMNQLFRNASIPGGAEVTRLFLEPLLVATRNFLNAQDSLPSPDEEFYDKFSDALSKMRDFQVTVANTTPVETEVEFGEHYAEEEAAREVYLESLVHELKAEVRTLTGQVNYLLRQERPSVPVELQTGI